MYETPELGKLNGGGVAAPTSRSLPDDGICSRSVSTWSGSWNPVSCYLPN